MHAHAILVELCCQYLFNWRYITLTTNNTIATAFFVWSFADPFFVNEQRAVNNINAIKIITITKKYPI